MKQKRLRRHLHVDPIDAVLDNVLLPALAVMVLVAFLWSVMK